MRTSSTVLAGAGCVDCRPNEPRQRVLIALAILGFTTFSVFLWRTFLDHLGDPFIAAMLVAVIAVTFMAPAAKLLR